MSINDPRLYLKNILTPIAVTKDDNVTIANVLVIFEGGPESFMTLFYINLYDGVVTIVRHEERESGPGKRIQDVPLRYFGDIQVHTTAIDRTGITATKLLNKIRLAIIALVEAAAQGPFPWASRATITVSQDRGISQIAGGFDPLWQDEFTISIRPYQDSG